jgi:predicted GNAT family N-acyltransferase
VSLVVRRANPEELDHLIEIRREVFVVGQGVPIEREIDGLDGEAQHFAAIEGNAYVGTARLRIVDGHAKLERVAVLAPWRERGVGGRLMDALEAHARGLGVFEAELSAQVPVIPFYERRGYVAEGPLFEDAGIPHRKMVKGLGGS